MLAQREERYVPSITAIATRIPRRKHFTAPDSSSVLYMYSTVYHVEDEAHTSCQICPFSIYKKGACRDRETLWPPLRATNAAASAAEEEAHSIQSRSSLCVSAHLPSVNHFRQLIDALMAFRWLR
jgi:hypothetical protein